MFDFTHIHGTLVGVVLPAQLKVVFPQHEVGFLIAGQLLVVFHRLGLKPPGLSLIAESLILGLPVLCLKSGKNVN